MGLILDSRTARSPRVEADASTRLASPRSEAADEPAGKRPDRHVRREADVPVVLGQGVVEVPAKAIVQQQSGSSAGLLSNSYSVGPKSTHS